MADEDARSRVDLSERVRLVELVDGVLNGGVVLTGDVVLSVANVDLVYLGLRVLLTSVASLEEDRRARLEAVA